MVLTWALTLASVFVVSLLGFAGVITLPFKGRSLQNIILFLVSFSVGALFGDAFLHLLPEAVEKSGFTIAISLSLLAGILTFFILEKAVCWRHCHVETSADHPHPFAWMNLVGDSLHNFIDGMVIAATYIASPQLGLATTLAVILHEIPQEIANYGVLIHGGFGRIKALFLNFLVQLTAVGGALLVLALNFKAEDFAALLIPFTAGGFIYIAGADLIPEIHKELGARRSLVQFCSIVLGLVLMLALLIIR